MSNLLHDRLSPDCMLLRHDCIMIKSGFTNSPIESPSISEHWT